MATGKGVGPVELALPGGPTPRGRVVYHGLRNETYTRENFLSREARGIPPIRPGPHYADLNRGVSGVATIDHVRELVRRLPGTRWRYAAVLEIPEDVRMEPSAWEGHYTVWAEPEQLVSWVRRVEQL